MADLAFIDCETSGLDPHRHAVWEIAVIRRTPDGRETEHLWQIRLNDAELAAADPEALKIGRYHERLAVPESAWNANILADGGPKPMCRDSLIRAVQATLDGTVMVGSNPSFDANFLRELLDDETWHYRTVDVATLAAGHVYGLHGHALEDGDLEAVTHPWKSYQLSRALGVEPPGPDVAHTALGDAKWCVAVYDAVTGGRP